jgi:hypothetical protein
MKSPSTDKMALLADGRRRLRLAWTCSIVHWRYIGLDPPLPKSLSRVVPGVGDNY